MFNKIKITFSILTLLLFSTTVFAADKVITFLPGTRSAELCKCSERKSF